MRRSVVYVLLDGDGQELARGQRESLIRCWERAGGPNDWTLHRVGVQR